MSDWESYTDEYLMRLKINGDEEAFEVLANRSLHGLPPYLVMMFYPSISAADAEDIALETVFKIHRYSELFDQEKGSFKSWEHVIATRSAVDYLRRPRLVSEVFDLRNVDRAPEGYPLVRELLSTLTKDEYKVVILTYFQGFSQEEASRILRVSQPTVSRRLHLALRHLRAQVEPVSCLEPRKETP